MVLRKIFILPLYFLCIQGAFAQEFKNIIAEFQGDKMMITYDLLCENPDQKFTITVYSSHNDYQTNLTNVIGDVGNNIVPGRGKKITWYLLTELPPNFNQTIQLKLIGTPFGFAEPTKKLEETVKEFKFISPGLNQNGKLGKGMLIKWQGANPDNDYQLELYAGETKRSDIATVSRDQSYLWKIPKKFDKGTNYKFRLINRINSGESVFSPVFSIKAKSPVVLIAAPVAVGAGVAYLLFGGKKTPPGPTPPAQLSDLPPPINP